MKIIITLCLISACMFAKELDFESLLNIAIQSNPKIQAFNDEIDALESASNIAGALPDPQISGGYFLTPIMTANGNQEWRVGVSQKLPWFGKLSSQRKVVLIQRDMRGADIMVPMALPTFGGMLVVVITIFVVPTLYAWIKESELKRKGIK